MILLGDSIVPYEKTFRIFHCSQIDETSPNSTVIFNFNQEILQYCNKNNVEFAVIVNSITEAIYANCLLAKYIICKNDDAKMIQDIAENYMFDSKVLAIINDSDEIEKHAKNSIDGAIYSHLLD